MPNRLHFHFNRNRKNVSKTIVLENGNTDYSALNPIDNAIAGQIVASVHLMEEGDDIGNDEVIDGPECLPPYAGENVALDESNPLLLRATANGCVFYENGIISVSPVFSTKGEVDFSTGNLTFVGHLSVNGSVRNGFSVLAGDVTVYGNIDDSHVRSANRVLVQGDIIGRNASVDAGGSVTCKYVENSSVVARGNIYVSVSSLNGQITSGDSVILREPGMVTGGRISCKNSLYARKIGTSWMNPTEIYLGDDPFLMKRLEEVRKMIQTLQHREAELEKGILPGRSSKSPDSPQLAMERKRTSRSLARFKLFEEQLQRRIGEEREQERNIGLYVFDRVMPGTKINIFDAKLYVKEAMEGSHFFYENGEIKFVECRQSMESLFG